MIKRLLMIITLLLLGCTLFGQTWVRSYSLNGLCPGPYDSGSSEVCNIIPAIGGGYLLQGYVEFAWGDIPAYDDNVFWKIDENGDLIWRRTGGASYPYNCIVSNGTDRYYCIEYDNMDVYDNEMNMLAHYVFNTINGFSASLYDMQYMEDGLVFAGKVDGGAIVIKTDFLFNVVWQSDSFFNYGFGFNAVEPYGDGWICLARGKLVEFTAVGDTVWTYTAVDVNTSIFDCKVSPNDNVYILGYYKLICSQMEEHQLETIANDIPASYYPEDNVSLEILPNGNLIYLSDFSSNQVLHCYSPNGVHQWSRAYEGLGAIYFGTGSKNLLVMPDGSILFCMYHGGIYLVKADSDGNVVANDDPIAPVPVASVAVYPQPAKSQVTISVKSADVGDLSYAIYNLRGQRVFSGCVNGHSREQSFALPEAAINQMQSGVYLVCLERRHKRIATTKLVVVK